MLPTASIVVPMHNCADRIGTLVGYLKAQTHEGFQAVLVDDGSDDGTVQRAIDAVAGDGRFVVLQQENAGPGAARNAGIDHSSGDYILFADADDVVDPSLIERVLGRAAQAANPDMVCYQLRAVWADGGGVLDDFDQWDAAGYSPVFDPVLHRRNLFGNFRNWPVDKAFKRTFLDEQGIRFPELYRTEDLAFTCSALASASRIALLDQQLYTYRVGGAASSTATRDAHAYDFYFSCLALRSFLEQKKLSATFRPSYVQWVGLCCMVNLMELRTEEAFEEVFALLRGDGLRDLGLARIDELNTPGYVAGKYTGNDVYRALRYVRAGNIERARKLRDDLPGMVEQRRQRDAAR